MAESNVERTLGILLAKVEGIEKSLERGDDHRAAVHQRVDDLVTEVGAIKIDLQQVKADVAETKEITDEVRAWKLMGMGALGVTGIAAAAVTWLVTYYWEAIVAWFRR